MKCLFMLLALNTFSSSVLAAEIKRPKTALEECESYLSHLEQQFPPSSEALGEFEDHELVFKRAGEQLAGRPMTELERLAFEIPEGSYDVSKIQVKVIPGTTHEALLQAWTGKKMLGERKVDFRYSSYAMLSPNYASDFRTVPVGRSLSKEDIRILMNIDLRSVVPIAEVGRHKLALFFRFYPLENKLMATAHIDLKLMRDCYEGERKRLVHQQTAYFLNAPIQCLTPVAEIVSTTIPMIH